MSQYSEKQYIANDDADRFYHSLFFKKGGSVLGIGCSMGSFIAQDPKNIMGICPDDNVGIAKRRVQCI